MEVNQSFTWLGLSVVAILSLTVGYELGSSKATSSYVQTGAQSVISSTTVQKTPSFSSAERQGARESLGLAASNSASPREEIMTASLESVQQPAWPAGVALLGLLGMAAGLLLLPRRPQAEGVPLAQGQSVAMAATTGVNPRYRCKTTEGDFVVELFMDRMPITASNWIDLADSGYYNGIHFHRVIDNFMLQFGCPYAKDPRHPRCGTGGPEPGTTFKVGDQTVTRNRGGNIPDELSARISNEPTTLSMANTGLPDSGGSQFFINTAHNDFLDWWREDLSPSKHPVFGCVVEGFDEVCMKIGKMKCDRRDSPIKPVQMISITKEP